MRWRARLRQRWRDLLDAFWLRPALMVAAAVALAEVLILLEGRVALPEALARWVYAGRTSGARDMLGVIASGSIGIAGTTFAITVAALSLASNQMGPRLLRNFTRDPTTQICLGALVATFAYALIVLRAVRGSGEGEDFVPAVAVSVALALALACVAALILFLHHVATSINLDHVVALVHGDLSEAIRELPARGARAGGEGGEGACPPVVAGDAAPLHGPDRGGYLEALEDEALADWAEGAGARLELRLRPGDFVFPGMVVGQVRPAAAARDAQRALDAATSLGRTRSVRQDLEFGARQLVEIGLRALSPSLNDPFTAIAVLDRLGATLCELARHELPPGVWRRGGEERLRRPVTDYGGLLDAMFHSLRQGTQSPAVLIRLLEVLAAVAEAEPDPARLREVARHIALAEQAAAEAAPDDGVRRAVAGRARAALEARRRGPEEAARAPAPGRSKVSP